MAYDDDELHRIWVRTDGRCHLCWRPLTLRRYGIDWHVEHGRALARGGTDHGNNLWAACIGCNLEKGTRGARAVRQRYGRTRAPRSRERVERARHDAAVAWGVGGFILGALVSPGGALLLAVASAIVGYNSQPSA